MRTEPRPVSLFDVAKRAVKIADPDGTDPRLGELVERFEDADEPITAVQNLEERVAIALEGVHAEVEDAAVSMAAAVISYRDLPTPSSVNGISRGRETALRAT